MQRQMASKSLNTTPTVVCYPNLQRLCLLSGLETAMVATNSGHSSTGKGRACHEFVTLIW